MRPILVGVIAGALAGLGVMHLLDAPDAKAQAKEAPPPAATRRHLTELRDADGLVRIRDEEGRATCWVATTYRGVSVHCLPDSPVFCPEKSP